jgi:hypothetical protein
MTTITQIKKGKDKRMYIYVPMNSGFKVGDHVFLVKVENPIMTVERLTRD